MGKENKRYYWLKFQEDFFSSLRVKKLRKLGSDYLIIYLKMQLFSLRNNGYLEFRGIEDTFAQELALELDEDADKVQLTLSFLQSCDLLEVRNDEFFLPYVELNTGSETASTIRSRESRANKGVALQHDCNKNATLEIRDKSIDNTLLFSNENNCQTENVRLVVEKWNELDCFGIKTVSKLSPTSKRYKSLVARIKEYSLEDVLKAVSNIYNSDFLKGKNNKGWQITFDWFVLPNNFPKVLEGNYNNKVQSKAENSNSKEFAEQLKARALGK